MMRYYIYASIIMLVYILASYFMVVRSIT